MVAAPCQFCTMFRFHILILTDRLTIRSPVYSFHRKFQLIESNVISQTKRSNWFSFPYNCWGNVPLSGPPTVRQWHISWNVIYLLYSTVFNILDRFGSRWRHQMETFSPLLAICAGNSPASGEFPAQRQVTRSFDVFFDLRLNKRLSKQSWGWWFETLSRPLWRHWNVGMTIL